MRLGELAAVHPFYIGRIEGGRVDAGDLDPATQSAMRIKTGTIHDMMAGRVAMSGDMIL